jgi:geranylgeranyl diphosphate synthase type II
VAARLKLWLSEQKQLIDSLLEGLLPGERDFPDTIHKAMRYSVFAGGKRLRPILTLECCRTCGGDPDSAAAAACAIECVHTYSLIHDDLPAMDDDDLRRGKPTCHKAFNEATAILTGDALLTFAFELLAAKAGEKSGQLAGELARAAGTKGMIGGQVLDIAEPPCAGQSGQVRSIHEMKTAALIQCACRMGAICADAPEGKLQALTDYGRNLGLSFQIADDILDVTSTPEQLGKATQKDIAAGKLTYPGVFGLEEATLEARQLCAAAKEALSSFEAEADTLRALADYVVERKS